MKAAHLVVLALATLVLSSAATAARAYDRQPIRISGLKPDQWGRKSEPAEDSSAARKRLGQSKKRDSTHTLCAWR